MIQETAISTKKRNRDLLYAYLTSLFVYLVTAYFSVGYHHVSEYVDVIEITLNHLWYGAYVPIDPSISGGEIPGFQPFMAFVILKGLGFLGISSPFDQMWMIRSATGLLCLGVTFVGLRFFLPDIREERLIQPMIFLTPLLWFLPYIYVRFSPETFSGCLFFLGAMLILLRHRALEKEWWTRIPYWISGLFLGFAFNTWFLIALLILGLILWMLIFGKMKWKPLLVLLAGILAAFSIGLLTTRWLYGEWCWAFMNFSGPFLLTLSPVNAWLWLKEIFFSGGYIVGLCVLFCLFYFWIRYFKNPATWISLPLFLFCLFIPVPDVRFLFPMTFVMTYMIIYSTQDLIRKARRSLPPWFRRSIYYGLTFLFLVANCSFLCLFTFKPADLDTGAVQYIHRNYDGQQILLLYADGSNPFEIQGCGIHQQRLYLPPDLEMHHVASPVNIMPYQNRKDRMVLVCVRKRAQDHGFIVNSNEFVKVFESLPHIYFTITGNSWEQEEDVIMLYQPKSCRLMF